MHFSADVNQEVVTYTGSMKRSSVVIWEDEAAPSTRSSKLLSPASPTFGMKSSST